MMILVCLDCISVHAEVDVFEDMGLFDTHLFDNDAIVTRNDCLSMVMMSIGLSSNARIDTYSTQELFLDTGNSVTESEMWYENYVDNCKFTEFGYVHLAREFTNVVAGRESIKLNGQNMIYFDYTGATTVKEALAFMVRCLGEYNSRNLEETFQIAAEIGLISDKDSFYQKPDVAISPNDFFVILQRFLQQKQYLYFDRKSNDKFRINNNSDISYADYLREPL